MTTERRRVRARIVGLVVSRGDIAGSVARMFFLLVIVMAVFGPIFSPHPPEAQSLQDRLQQPTADHLLGTDAFGRDVLSRVLLATRTSGLAILQAVGVAVVVGIPAGLLAGYQGGRLDTALSRVADALLSLPPLILAIAIVGIVGQGLTTAMVAIGVILSPRLFRVARSAAMSIATETYIEAARSIGCSPRRILRKHVFPNAAQPLLVQVTFAAGLSATAEAVLSFLGLGVTPPTPSWGSMIQDAYRSIYERPTLLVAPAVLLTGTILALSTLADGIDARLSRKAGNRE